MGKAKIHKLNDMTGQNTVNKAWEKAWDEGKHKPSLEEVNKEWAKVYGKGKDKKWKKTPKYDPLRGSGGGEGYGKVLNED